MPQQRRTRRASSYSAKSSSEPKGPLLVILIVVGLGIGILKGMMGCNEGGHYDGGVGSSHKGGHYTNSATDNHYEHHK